jgi:hypothetical protein
MEFGLLKSKIEKKLIESYSNKTFNSEIKNFNTYVLNNKDVSKIYYIYNKLSESKDFEISFAEDFVNECIDLYSRVKVNKKSIVILESWLKDVKTNNNYKDIDVILEKNTLVVENILNAKKRIISNLSTKGIKIESINLPIEKIYEVAKDNLKKYLSELNESDLTQIKKYLTLSESELQKRYDVLSEMVIEKLDLISNDSDKETKDKITETISKIKNDKVDSVNLMKLKSLNETL